MVKRGRSSNAVEKPTSTSPEFIDTESPTRVINAVSESDSRNHVTSVPYSGRKYSNRAPINRNIGPSNQTRHASSTIGRPPVPNTQARTVPAIPNPISSLQSPISPHVSPMNPVVEATLVSYEPPPPTWTSDVRSCLSSLFSRMNRIETVSSKLREIRRQKEQSESQSISATENTSTLPVLQPIEGLSSTLSSSPYGKHAKMVTSDVISHLTLPDGRTGHFLRSHSDVRIFVPSEHSIFPMKRRRYNYSIIVPVGNARSGSPFLPGTSSSSPASIGEENKFTPQDSLDAVVRACQQSSLADEQIRRSRQKEAHDLVPSLPLIRNISGNDSNDVDCFRDKDPWQWDCDVWRVTALDAVVPEASGLAKSSTAKNTILSVYLARRNRRLMQIAQMPTSSNDNSSFSVTNDRPSSSIKSATENMDEEKKNTFTSSQTTMFIQLREKMNTSSFVEYTWSFRKTPRWYGLKVPLAPGCTSVAEEEKKDREAVLLEAENQRKKLMDEGGFSFISNV